MRLIDADDFKRRILAFCTACRCTFLSVEGIVAAINNSDTVDAVPVVRCKECEHAERYERTDGTAGYSCGHPQNIFVFGDRWDRVFEPIKEPDDFCSYGERRTNQSADVRNMGQFAGDGKTNGGSNERP